MLACARVYLFIRPPPSTAQCVATVHAPVTDGRRNRPYLLSLLLHLALLAFLFLTTALHCACAVFSRPVLSALSSLSVLLSLLVLTQSTRMLQRYRHLRGLQPQPLLRKRVRRAHPLHSQVLSECWRRGRISPAWSRVEPRSSPRLSRACDRYSER